MGMQLDYETGRTVIGHHVKLLGQPGFGPGLGMLMEAHPDYAVVKPNRHQKNERILWRYVYYHKAGNARARENGRAAG